MNTLEQLVKEARQRRDDAISQAREHYDQTVKGLKKASRKSRVVVKSAKRYSAKHSELGDYSRMTTRAAAEALLLELGPLNLAELVVGLQARGHRSQDAPRRVSNAIRMALEYHEGRFSRDGEGRWVAS